MRIFGFLLVLCGQCILAQENPRVYLIPGQGSDHRVFNNLKIDTRFDTAHIHYFTPDTGWTMRDFAMELSTQIDTAKKFVIVGYSLGGMIATEMSYFLNPDKTIIISSAKCSNELPTRYTFQKKIPVYELVSAKTAKKGAQVLQPIVEPDRKNEKETFKNMLADKDPEFLKRTIGMIISWENQRCNGDIIHIHGDNDKTIPSRNVDYDYLIDNGSHLMLLTRGDEISSLINEILIQE